MDKALNSRAVVADHRLRDFLRSEDHLASVRGHFCAKSSTAPLSQPKVAPCIKIKREGISTFTNIPILYLLGFM